MAAVQQRILNWLYSVLTSEYQDVNRTYSDVAQTLSYYSSLSPRTEVYTYENGASSLLLQLSGTLPVAFRGTTYRFPVAIWIPHKYPQEGPMIYVTPTEGMMIRAGQYVDPQGRVYHPYLMAWAQFWDKSNVLDFLAILRDIFAKEPPVIARQQRGPGLSSPTAASTPPPIPPLPRDLTGSPSGTSSIGIAGPPPPPPKQYSTPQAQSPQPNSDDRRTSGPPLPALPTEISRPNSQAPPQLPPYSNTQGLSHYPQRQSSLRYESGPPLPPQPMEQGVHRASTDNPHTPGMQGLEHQAQPLPSMGQHGQYLQQHRRPVASQLAFATPQRGYPPPLQPWPQEAQGPSSHANIKKLPPPDLLDEPLTVSLPTESQTPLPAPPIPPNPEKDLLLNQLAQALYAQRQQVISQTQSSLPGLQAQHTAMLSALSAMQAEVSSLTALSQTLTSNTSILQSSLVQADKTIQDSQHKAPPGIDEILVAPTVVGNQLYELVSEERALGDALFVLGRAVERGRIAAPAFVKTTRGMAREWFLKKALVKKIGKGMGLDTAASLSYQR